jgi:hypothetical protein
MEQRVTGKAQTGISQPVDTDLLLLVSHDTNILYLRELLDINWTPYGYTTGVASTGGSLQFELWRSKDNGEYFVKVSKNNQDIFECMHLTYINYFFLPHRSCTTTPRARTSSATPRSYP